MTQSHERGDDFFVELEATQLGRVLSVVSVEDPEGGHPGYPLVLVGGKDGALVLTALARGIEHPHRQRRPDIPTGPCFHSADPDPPRTAWLAQLGGAKIRSVRCCLLLPCYCHLCLPLPPPPTTCPTARTTTEKRGTSRRRSH